MAPGSAGTVANRSITMVRSRVTTQSARSCVDGVPNIVPTDDDAIAFSRSAGQVLDIVYPDPAAVTSGDFPDGVNGDTNASDDNS